MEPSDRILGRNGNGDEHTAHMTPGEITRVISVFPEPSATRRASSSPGHPRVVRQRLSTRRRLGMSRPSSASASARVKDTSRQTKTRDLHDVIAQGNTSYGMQTFDQSLMALFRSGLISYHEALLHCSNPSDFELKVRGIASTSDSRWDNFEKSDSDGTTSGGDERTSLDIDVLSGGGRLASGPANGPDVYGTGKSVTAVRAVLGREQDGAIGWPPHAHNGSAMVPRAGRLPRFAPSLSVHESGPPYGSSTAAPRRHVRLQVWNSCRMRRAHAEPLDLHAAAAAVAAARHCDARVGNWAAGRVGRLRRES